MGNGRESGRSPRSSGSVGWVQVLGAMLVLLLAAAALVGSGSRHHAQRATAELPESPFQAAVYRSSAQSSPRKPDARAILEQLPLIFEPNQGQANASVKFLSRGAGYSLFLDASGAVLGLRTAHSSSQGVSERWLRMKLVGANAAAATAGTNRLPGKTNYFIGNDPSKWHCDIPQFAGVRYENVYPGIDLVFYGNQGHLEYDFRVAPGADAAQAELQFDGATKLELSGGDLILTGEEDGGVRLHAPQIYQPDGDRRKPVAGRFVLRADNRVGFEIAPYDHSRELVIDPLLDFSTYFGGSGSETSPSVAANGDGNIYLAGSTTTSAGFPGTGTPLGSANNVFVAKIDPSSPPVVVYLTFLGGNGTDTSVGLGVDNGGNAYIAGNTTSTNFPTAGIPYQPPPKGAQCASITCSSVFVSVLNPAGSSLNYSTYVAGNGNDIANAMTIDSNRDVFLIGNTTSNDVPSLTDAFPATYLPKPFQSSPAASLQLFITKVNTSIPGIGAIAYSTYFGGTSPAGAVATGGGIAVDSTGNIYFSGTTNFYNSGSGLYGNSGTSGDFPILNAYQPCLDTVPPTILSVNNPCAAPATPYPTDAFVAKINPNGQTGTQLLFSTYFGGTAADSSAGLAIDSGAANIYITGSTNSSDFVIPTGTAAFDTCLNNANPIGSTAACSTANTTDTDAYVARFSNPAVSTTGTPLDVAFTYFSYLGGSGNDSGLAIAVDTASDALVTGSTQSNNFPVTVLLGPIQSSLNGTQDAFFARINTTTISGQNGVGSYVTYFGGSGVDSGTSIAVDPVSLNTYFAGQTNSTDLHLANPFSLPPPAAGQTEAFLVELGTVANLCITCVAPIVSPLGTAPVGQPVSVTFTLTNEGPDVATGIGIRGSVSNSNGVTFNSGTAGSGTCSAPASNEVVCTIPTLQPGSTSSIVFSVTPIVAGSFDATATVFEVNNTNSNLVESAPFTVSDYFVTVSPAGQTVPAGQLAQYSVTVSPTKGVFSGSVSLTCSSLPPSTTSNFSNSTLTFNGGNTSTTLFLQTTPQPVNVASSQPWQRPFYALWIMIPGMAIWGLGAGGKTRRGRWLGGLALFVFFALVLVQPSCSHSSRSPAVPTGTPSGTYSLTVTATSGSFSTSQGFQLTVIP